MAARFWLKGKFISSFSMEFLSSKKSYIATMAKSFNYLSYFFTSWTNMWGKFRSTTFPSTFSHFIFNIIKVSSNKKVGRVYTNRIVTFMKNIHAFWNRAISKLPTKSMNFNRFIFNTKLTVFAGFSTCRFSLPYPTIIGLFNFSPESLFRSSVQWISMSKNSFIVNKAHVFCFSFIRAVFNYTNYFHIYMIPQHRRVFYER